MVAKHAVKDAVLDNFIDRPPRRCYPSIWYAYAHISIIPTKAIEEPKCLRYRDIEGRLCETTGVKVYAVCVVRRA